MRAVNLLSPLASDRVKSFQDEKFNVVCVMLHFTVQFDAQLVAV